MPKEAKMKRLALFITLMSVLFVGATLYADSMSSGSPASPWVGKTTVDLLVNLGVPTYTDQLPSGEKLVYVKHEGVGPNTSVNVIRQFDVDSSGKITAEQDSQE
jgi:hypothetical protein